MFGMINCLNFWMTFQSTCHNMSQKFTENKFIPRDPITLSGVSSPPKRKVFRFHYHSQKMLGSLGQAELSAMMFLLLIDELNGIAWTANLKENHRSNPETESVAPKGTNGRSLKKKGGRIFLPNSEPALMLQPPFCKWFWSGFCVPKHRT